MPNRRQEAIRKQIEKETGIKGTSMTKGKKKKGKGIAKKAVSAAKKATKRYRKK